MPSLAAQENARREQLQCSHYRPRGMGSTPVPCVIYCHCNSGSRRDAEEALYVLLPHNIGVFCLDFAVWQLPLLGRNRPITSQQAVLRWCTQLM